MSTGATFMSVQPPTCGSQGVQVEVVSDAGSLALASCLQSHEAFLINVTSGTILWQSYTPTSPIFFGDGLLFANATSVYQVSTLSRRAVEVVNFGAISPVSGLVPVSNQTFAAILDIRRSGEPWNGIETIYVVKL